MEQLLQNGTVVAAIVGVIGAIGGALVLIIWALGRRIAGAIEGGQQAGQAVSELELRQRVADEVVAAVEQLAAHADGGDKLQQALDLAHERGVKLVRSEIEAALKRAEATWRMPVWVSDAAAGMTLIGPEGTD